MSAASEAAIPSPELGAGYIGGEDVVMRHRTGIVPHDDFQQSNEGRRANRDASFLQHFPRHRVGQRLTCLDQATRQGPTVL